MELRAPPQSIYRFIWDQLATPNGVTYAYDAFAANMQIFASALLG